MFKLNATSMDQQPASRIPPEYLEQNPLIAIVFTLFLLLLVAFIIGTLTSWVFLFIRAIQGKPVLTPEPWKPRVWGFVDILVAVALVYFWQRQSASLGCNLLGLNRAELIESQTIPLPLATILGLGNVTAMLCVCAWLFARHHASLAQLGFSFVRWWKHIAIGVVAAVAAIPLVYALMAAVNVGFDSKYSHPLLEEMKREGSLTAYLLAVTSAVLIAPLVEEFLFRVIIQGWLQSAPFGTIKAIFFGQREEAQLALGATSVELTSAPNQDPPRIPHEITVPRSETTDTTTETTPLVPPIWPSFVTGTLFGLVHFGYGLSFIPLIVLGIILGLLYRATHSIWPSLVVHFILNGSSMLALGIAILLEQATK